MADRGTVLVGVDGSPGSHRACEWAARYATAMGAEVLAVHVLTVDEEFLRDMPPSGFNTWRSRMQEQLDGKWTESLAAVAHRCELVRADAIGEGLARAADDHDAELIVLGTHGRPHLRERILGATTYGLSQRAHRPLVIVPPDWEITSPRS